MNEVIDAMFERVVSTKLFRFLPCVCCVITEGGCDASP